jgi:hypothetical protein
MNRREFLTQTVGGVQGLLCRRNFATALQNISSEPQLVVKLDSSQTVATVPADFIGLGYETSSIARPGLLSSQNAVYVQLVRTLGKQGVIRVGGNTSDYASYKETGEPSSSPEKMGGSVINAAVLRDLGSFLDATGWQLIWGLNLGNGTPENAIREAHAVIAAAKNHLIAFEIGNEPDLFSSHQSHRPTGYGYDKYLREYRTYRDALRKAIPDVPLAGPDAADAPDWVVRFARDEGTDIKLLTHHYYREGQNPSSTIEKLLHPDPKLDPLLAKFRSASDASRVPFRICETNSFSGGGKPGVSDTFAAALWVLDFMFTLAAGGCAGVNIETGVNQLGFISSYSPIGDDERGHYWATPEYYGMLAFAQSGRGRVIGCSIDTRGRNINAYATQAAPDRVMLIIINKEPSLHADILVDAGAVARFRSRSLCRLLAPSLESKLGITLGGADVSSEGLWRPSRIEDLGTDRGLLRFSVPAASAAIVTLNS